MSRGPTSLPPLGQRGRIQRQQIQWWNALVVGGSVLMCMMLLPMRILGFELLGVVPHWPLIWVVAWSVKRRPWEGAMAGLVLGLLQDAMTAPHPTHTLSLVLVGVLTAKVQTQRYLQEDLVSVALIVFVMAVLAETVLALQMSASLLLSSDAAYPSLREIWEAYQRIALSSAILSSLWAPAIFYPLNRWWERVAMLRDRS